MLIKGIVPAALLTGLLLLVSCLAGLSALKAADDLTVPAAVALVDEENSLISRFCIGMVENTDYVQGLLTIEKTDKEQALEGLGTGRFAAAIILPEDYTQRILYGEACKGAIILSEKAETMGELVQRTAALGEKILAAGQYGVFAGEELIRSAGSSGGDYGKFLSVSNALLIEKALDMGSSAFDTVVLPYSGFGIGTASHFALCWACAFLSLCGMFFSALYTADRREDMRDRLRSCGVGTGCFISGKVLWPFVFRGILLGAILLAADPFLAVDCSVTSILCALAGLLFCTCFTSGLALAFPGSASWIVLLMSTAGLFLCGAIVPLQYLPLAYFQVGKLLPLGAFSGTLAPVLGAEVDPASIVICALWGIAALVCAFVMLSLRQGGGEEQ